MMQPGLSAAKNETIGPGTFSLIENVVRGGVDYRFLPRRAGDCRDLCTEWFSTPSARSGSLAMFAAVRRASFAGEWPPRPHDRARNLQSRTLSFTSPADHLLVFLRK
jgi:hypothetical protein